MNCSTCSHLMVFHGGLGCTLCKCSVRGTHSFATIVAPTDIAISTAAFVNNSVYNIRRSVIPLGS